jgi:hypothetical protein
MSSLRTYWRDVKSSWGEEKARDDRVQGAARSFGRLRRAGGEANNAANEIAAAFDAFDRGLTDFAAELKTIEGELTFLTWMMGFNLVITAVILWRVFAHGV